MVILLCLLLCLPLYAQQVTLSAGGSFSQGGITSTLSIGEIFTNLSPPSSGSSSSDAPSLSTGATGPATDAEISASPGQGEDSAVLPVDGGAIEVSYDPAAQAVRIRISGTVGEPRVCGVYNLNGLLWRMAPLEAGRENTVLLNELSQGIYILKVTAGNDSKTIKLIKR